MLLKQAGQTYLNKITVGRIIQVILAWKKLSRTAKIQSKNILIQSVSTTVSKNWNILGVFVAMMIKEEIIHHLWDLRFMIFYGGKSFEKRFEKDLWFR